MNKNNQKKRERKSNRDVIEHNNLTNIRFTVIMQTCFNKNNIR